VKKFILTSLFLTILNQTGFTGEKKSKIWLCRAKRSFTYLGFYSG